MSNSKKNDISDKINKCILSIKIFKYFVAFLSFLIVFGFQNIYGQDAKKNKVRIKVDYVKIMDGEVFFDIKTSSRIDKKNVDVKNIDLTVYNEFDGEEIEIGSTTTNMNGESRLTLGNLNSLKPDSTSTYNVVFSFNGNDSFKRASKSLSFKDAAIRAKIILKDSIHHITATLTDTSRDSVIVGESLNVQVQRLFMPLKIGKEFNYTDENGTIVVPIEKGIPGVNGNLIIEVVLYDSDEYGTIKALVNAPIGVPIVDESTFDQRKMWSPRNKTPLFLLIFPNLLIVGIWGIIIYLIINLFKITKTKI
jgi:hypothetical protein